MVSLKRITGGARLLLGAVAVAAFAVPATAADKPNIVVIWGDDIGISNVSAYSEGLMGYQTPNIDRLAKEGMKFTDYYAENSCTAGRAAFITGQSVFRTGNSKVGLPGAKQGLNPKDPSIAELPGGVSHFLHGRGNGGRFRRHPDLRAGLSNSGQSGADR
jgi:hypothetical protein